MKINIEEHLAHPLPWELAITRGGVDYATRRPLVAELASLDKISSMPLADAMAFVQTIFTGDAKPAIASFTADELFVVLIAYNSYFMGWAEKNCRAISARVKAEIAANRAAGSSSSIS